ncbi:unnamed protein product [Pelagomonas calceolata]|uniref:Tubulin--tyrosine ligase-like protein 9 n=1 Tax=Pelagomonas calceolata TaxID=35677 RepID=A0A8J2SF64_9STRA|nr:unnamed protein product [Pelagomonas calceolata]
MPRHMNRRKRRGVSTRCVSALALALVLAWVFMITHLLSQEPTPAPTPEKPHTHTGRKNHTKKHHRRHKKKKRTPAPTASPTNELKAAHCWPFNRQGRYVKNTIQKPVNKWRRFRVGPRKDLENFVAPMLKKLGLLQTKYMDWNVYVGLQFKPDYEKNYLVAPEGALITSIPGLKEVFGDKEAFARLWSNCAQQVASLPITDGEKQKICSFTRPAINAVHKMTDVGPQLAVEGGAQAFFDIVDTPSAWIVKPQRRYLSLGMHLAVLRESDAASLDTLASWLSKEVPVEEKLPHYRTKQPGEFTLQQYVARPARLDKRKFDLRVWVLITSLEPLTVFMLDVAFPKISVVDYTAWDFPANASTVNEKCMHVQLMAAEVCVKKINARHMYPYQYPGVTRPDVHGKVGGRSFFENLRLDDNDLLGGEEAWREWQERLWPELEALIMRPLLLAKPALHKHEARIYGEFDGDLSRKYHRVALVSPDVIYDADAKTWTLEEINTNGLFQLGVDDGGSSFHVDEGYTEAWLQMSGVDEFPNSHKYQKILEERLNDFCESEGCTEWEKSVLMRSAHATAHVNSGWYRVWPPYDCGQECGPRSTLEKDAGLRALHERTASPLAKKHWTFLRKLDRTAGLLGGDGEYPNYVV